MKCILTLLLLLLRETEDQRLLLPQLRAQLLLCSRQLLEHLPQCDHRRLLGHRLGGLGRFLVGVLLLQVAQLLPGRRELKKISVGNIRLLIHSYF